MIEAEDGIAIEADHIYVIPPDATLPIRDRRTVVSRLAPHARLADPSTHSFPRWRDQGDNAVCIVLSGTGSDGTGVLVAVKENGGPTLAQAEFDHSAMQGMPQSATNSGQVDFVLPVDDVPAKLIDYQRHLARLADRKNGDGTRKDVAGHLGTITALLRTKTGNDFNKYREKTVTRRIQRRMQILQTDTFPAYIDRPRSTAQESELRFRELLIGMANPSATPNPSRSCARWRSRRSFGRKHDDAPLRFWITGCSIRRRDLFDRHSGPRGDGTTRSVIDRPDFRHRHRRLRGRPASAKLVCPPERLERWFVEDDEDWSARSGRCACSRSTTCSAGKPKAFRPG